MSKYDEFDLNLQGENNDSGTGPASLTLAECISAIINSYYYEGDCPSGQCTISEKTECKTTLASETGCHR